MKKLPIALGKEPLVDAVFEVRFGGNPHLADILPGVLFEQLSPKPTLHRLPFHEMPEPVRAVDPNLMFAPLIRLDSERFSFSVGDRNFVVGCKPPYPKWPAFKSAILDYAGRVAKTGIDAPIERFSVKYVNVVAAPTIEEQLKKVEMSLRLGDIHVTEDHISLSVHHNENDIVHILSIVTGAQAKLWDGRSVFGVVVDIDTIKNAKFPNLSTFLTNLEPSLEALRHANKTKFFDCLTDAAIEEMEPRYV